MRLYLKTKILVLAPVLLLVSCERHKRHDFDAVAHQSEWSARAPESPDLAEFAAKLSQAHSVHGPLDPSDGLSLSEAEVVGLFYNGDLRTSRARLAGMLAGADKAGLWPDPSLNLSVLRMLDKAAVEPWLLGADAAMTLPMLGGMKGIKRLARARAEAEAWGVAEREWNYVRELRRLWIQWSALDAEATLTAEQIEAVSKMINVVQTLSDAGEIPRTESRLFSIERAGLEIEHHHFSHEAEETVMMIHRLLGFQPGATLNLISAIRPFEIPEINPHEHGDDTEMIGRHPTVRRAEAEHAEKAELLDAARRAAWGAMELGAAYEREDGEQKAGGRASLTLPLWNRNQQAIVEAEAELEAAKIARASEIERMTSELAVAEHRLEAAQADWTLLSEKLAPLVQVQLDEARALAELGEFDPLLLLEAFKKSYETRVRMIEVQAEIALAGVDVMHIASHQPMPARLEEMIHHEGE